MIAPNSFLGISGSKFFFEKDKKVIIEIKYTFQEKFRNEFTYKWRLLLASKTRLLRYIVYVLCFYTITLIIIIVIDFDGLRNFHKKANAFVMEWLMDIIGLMFFVRFSFRLLNYAVFLFISMFNSIWCSNSCPFFKIDILQWSFLPTPQLFLLSIHISNLF